MKALLTADKKVNPSVLMRQGVPVGRPAEIELRNQHLTYAITW